jgi:hypothetical protein
VGLRETIKSNAAALLEPGEEIQAVIPAQLSPPAARSFIPPQRVTLVATDHRILVCKSGRYRITPVAQLISELPRDTQIGPVAGIWSRRDVLPLGLPIWIHQRFRKDVDAADAARPGGAATW